MGSVLIGYPASHMVHTDWARTMMEMLVFELTQRRRLVGLAPIIGTRVAVGRNSIVRKFLEETNADWLFFIDTDMVVSHDLLERMLERAESGDYPILGALCYGVRGDDKFAVMFDYDEASGSHLPILQPWDQTQKVDATGAAALLIRRDVLLAMRDRYPNPIEWFADELYNGRYQGEDITFCRRARELGFSIHVATDIVVGHIKPFAIDNT